MATILVVDDRSDNRELLVDLLSCSGHEMQEAADGVEALAMAIRDHPDLVITDILMPTMDGYEFLRHLRADPEVGATPVIFYTAIYHQSEARALAEKCGVTRLLTKPVDVKEVVRTVSEVLGLVRSSDGVVTSDEIDRDHLHLLNDTLAEKVLELEAANARLLSLIDLGSSLAQERDPGRLLVRCCLAGREMLGAHHVILAMLDEGGKRIDRLMTEGLDEVEAARLGHAGLGEGLLSRVAAECVSVRSAAVRAEGRPLWILPGHPPAGSFLGVPVATAGKLYGVLAFVDKGGGGRFDAEDEGLARSLAAQLAISYEGASRQAEIERHAARLERYADRLEILRRIDQAILSNHRPREVASAALYHLQRLVDCWSIGVWVIDWEERTVLKLAEVGAAEPYLPAWTKMPLGALGAEDIAAIRAAQERVVEDVASLDESSQVVRILRPAGLRSYIRLPMTFEGRVIGTLALGSDRTGPFEVEQLEIARQVADQLAIAIRHSLLFDQVCSGRKRMRILSRQLLRAQEEERKCISRELHDEIGQSLTAMKINLQRAKAASDLNSASPYIGETDGLIDRTLQQVRHISLDLRPSMLDDLGLAASMRSHLDRTARLGGFVGHFAADPPEIRLPAEIETECFRIAQEALTNVVRHARARQVDVALSRRAERLDLVVQDDGTGFDVAAAREHAASGGSLGLLGMQERAALLGGRISIKARPGLGTKVHLRVPLASNGSPSYSSLSDRKSSSKPADESFPAGWTRPDGPRIDGPRPRDGEPD
jgi:signal transduction histidine kinase/DNA-binding response OmpR family regulator